MAPPTQPSQALDSQTGEQELESSMTGEAEFCQWVDKAGLNTKTVDLLRAQDLACTQTLAILSPDEVIQGLQKVQETSRAKMTFGQIIVLQKALRDLR